MNTIRRPASDRRGLSRHNSPLRSPHFEFAERYHAVAILLLAACCRDQARLLQAGGLRYFASLVIETPAPLPAVRVPHPTTTTATDCLTHRSTLPCACQHSAAPSPRWTRRAAAESFLSLLEIHRGLPPLPASFSPKNFASAATRRAAERHAATQQQQGQGQGQGPSLASVYSDQANLFAKAYASAFDFRILVEG